MANTSGGRGRDLFTLHTVVTTVSALALVIGSWVTVRAQAPSKINTGFLTPFPGTGAAVVYDNFFLGPELPRLIVAGSTGESPHRDIQVLSYQLPDPLGRPEGLDTGWGPNHDGRTVVDLGGDDEAFAVTLDGFGRILVVGATLGRDNQDFFLARFTRAGIVDTTFGGGKGWVTVDMGSQDIATAVAVDTQERLVVAGLSFQSSILNPFDLGDWDCAVVRFLDNGDRDIDFGDDGVVIEGLTNFEVPSAIAFDRHADFFDDRIWVVGSYFDEADDFSQIFIMHFQDDGDLDLSFGDPPPGTPFPSLPHSGRATRSFGQRWSQAADAMFDREGRLIITGSVSPGHQAFTDTEFHNANLAIARFKNDGTPDQSFGDHGVTITDVTGRDDFGATVRIDSKFRWLVSGAATTLLNHRDMVVARYDFDGHLDQTYGGRGFVTARFNVDGLPASLDFGAPMTFTQALGADTVVVGTVQSQVTGNFFAAIKGFGEEPRAVSLAATPALSVVAGSTSSTLTVTSENGFEGTVTVTLAGDRNGGPLPAGFTATLAGQQTLVAQVQLTSGGATPVPIHVDVAPFVVPGTYTLWLTSDPDPLDVNTIPLAVTVRADPTSVRSVVNRFAAAGVFDNAGIANALVSKLTAADTAIQSGDSHAATNTLAAFVNQVQAQRGKHIAASATIDGSTFDPSAILLADARDAIGSLKAGAANAIAGYVTDAAAREIRDAQLILVDSANAVVTSATTDSTGFYYFATVGTLVPGTAYSIRVDPLPRGFSTVAPSAQFFTWGSAAVTLPTFVAR